MAMKYNLPKIRGRYTENADLSKTNWFQVGGPAEVLFKPAHLDDLVFFLKNKPDCPITILGVGSNIIIRDGGIDGVVIKLGREFAKLAHYDNIIEAGAATLDLNAALFAAENSITGMEFLSGIPGGIGGAVAMNAGAYSKEIKDVLIAAELVDMAGEIHKFSGEELQFTYRRCGKIFAQPFIVSKAWLQGSAGDSAEIYARMNQIKEAREATQPIRARTGGSTFKNPAGYKAWELIDKAGCRGLTTGAAQVSEKHCNFFVNTGGATAADLEGLIVEVQRRVFKNSGIKLEAEIKTMGTK